jgi:hypothetical protein
VPPEPERRIHHGSILPLTINLRSVAFPTQYLEIRPVSGAIDVHPVPPSNLTHYRILRDTAGRETRSPKRHEQRHKRRLVHERSFAMRPP